MISVDVQFVVVKRTVSLDVLDKFVVMAPDDLAAGIQHSWFKWSESCPNRNCNCMLWDTFIKYSLV